VTPLDGQDEESLTPEEFDRRLRETLSDEGDAQEVRSLIDWFQRRYPTARERLAYVRRKYAEWTRRPVSITPAER
jgi:hypothetical protein